MARTPFELKGRTVFVAGHGGMVGGALLRRLASEQVTLLTAGRSEIDLCDQAAVNKWFAARRPQVLFFAAAKVGGIVEQVPGAKYVNSHVFLGNPDIVVRPDSAQTARVGLSEIDIETQLNAALHLLGAA